MALDVEKSSLEDEEDQIVDPLVYSSDEDDLHGDCNDDACVGVVMCYPQLWIIIIGSVLVFFIQSYKVEIRNVR